MFCFSFSDTCRDIPLITLQSSKNSSNSYSVALVSLMSAADPLSFHLSQLLVARILQNPSPLLDSLTLFIVPILNPDGYIRNTLSSPNDFSLNPKNTGPGCSTDIKNLGGVNLNTNFPSYWKIPFSTSTSSSSSLVSLSSLSFLNDPCHFQYHGPFPLSEPETTSFAKFISLTSPNALFQLSSHPSLWINTSRILYPYQYQLSRPVPPKDQTVLNQYLSNSLSVSSNGNSSLIYKSPNGNFDDNNDNDNHDNDDNGNHDGHHSDSIKDFVLTGSLIDWAWENVSIWSFGVNISTGSENPWVSPFFIPSNDSSLFLNTTSSPFFSASSSISSIDSISTMFNDNSSNSSYFMYLNGHASSLLSLLGHVPNLPPPSTAPGATHPMYKAVTILPAIISILSALILVGWIALFRVCGWNLDVWYRRCQQWIGGGNHPQQRTRFARFWQRSSPSPFSSSSNHAYGFLGKKRHGRPYPRSSHHYEHSEEGDFDFDEFAFAFESDDDNDDHDDYETDRSGSGKAGKGGRGGKGKGNERHGWWELEEVGVTGSSSSSPYHHRYANEKKKERENVIGNEHNNEFKIKKNQKDEGVYHSNNKSHSSSSSSSTINPTSATSTTTPTMNPVNGLGMGSGSGSGSGTNELKINPFAVTEEGFSEED